MLELKNVRKTYKTKSGEVHALDGVSLTFPSKGMVFITGKSGCGKTTLLNVIGGLDGFDEGEISILGRSFSTFSPTEYDGYRNTLIGFIFQEYNLLPEFTVEKNIKIAMEIQGGAIDEQAFNALVKSVGIHDLMNRKPNELSGGQRQRVAIARALLKNPRIIMGDEPTGALDSNTGTQVLDTLKELSKEKLVIIVSHDQDFAEKYADRIIKLVDGRVEEDITFSENEIETNISDNGHSIVVKQGAILNEEEKDLIALAVKERKKIEFTEKLSYRQSQETGEVINVTPDSPVVLKKSKMKLKSSVALGVKSLGVKPFRLLFTVLLSAIAFAVFGLFDTIANFSTANVISNLLRTASSPTVVAGGEYVINEKENDSYDVKISQDEIDKLEDRTGFTIKGIYDLDENKNGFTRTTYAINEIYSSNVLLGKKYYTNYVNGFIEFDRSEISDDGNLGSFGYKLMYGEYPELRYIGETKVVDGESLYDIAISSYLAESIIHYLNGNPLSDKVIKLLPDLIGEKITVKSQQYTIIGIIDCGDIPERYAPLKESTSTNNSIYTLSEDFSSYINSGAHKCIFVAEGYLKHFNEESNRAKIFYTGDSTWSVTQKGITQKCRAQNYAYASRYYDLNNVALFSGEYAENNKLTLSDEQVLIHSANLKTLFNNKFALLSAEDKEKANGLFTALKSDYISVENARNKMSELMALLFTDDEIRNQTLNVTKMSDVTHESVEETVEVVGIYFGIDIGNEPLGNNYRFMFNDSLLSHFKVYNGQGEYSRILFSPKSNAVGRRIVAGYMCNETGFVLNWYGNSALSVINGNEETIRQAADLFLYVAIALALFSVFMFFNYIVTSIVNKRPSIGVLRGLGSGGKDIFRMFISESIIIALINGVLAACFAAIGCVFVNMYIANVMYISIPFALFGFRQGLIIFAMSILTAILSSILPIIKIAKEKPVDLIRKL